MLQGREVHGPVRQAQHLTEEGDQRGVHHEQPGERGEAGPEPVEGERDRRIQRDGGEIGERREGHLADPGRVLGRAPYADPDAEAEQHLHRGGAQEHDQEPLSGQARPGGAGDEHAGEASRGLLGAHPEHPGDGEGDRADREHHQHEGGERAGEVVEPDRGHAGQVREVLREVGERAGEGAEGEREEEQSDAPGQMGPADQPPGEAARGEQRGRSGGASGGGRAETGPQVAAVREPAGDHQQHGGGGEGDEQGPPAQVHESAHLLRPGERREPGQPRAVAFDHVADAAHHEGERQDPQRRAGGGAGVLGELGGDRGDRAEDQSCQGGREPERQRVRRPSPADQHSRGHRGAEGEVRQRHHQQGGDRRGEAAGGQGAQQLEPSGLLLAAGEAGGEQDRHDRGRDEQVEQQLVGDHGPEGVVVGGEERAGHHHGRGVVQQRRAGVERGLIGVDVLHRVDRGGHEHEHGQGPDQDASPGEAEVEAEQGAQPGERADRAALPAMGGGGGRGGHDASSVTGSSSSP